MICLCYHIPLRLLAGGEGPTGRVQLPQDIVVTGLRGCVPDIQGVGTEADVSPAGQTEYPLLPGQKEMVQILYLIPNSPCYHCTCPSAGKSPGGLWGPEPMVSWAPSPVRGALTARLLSRLSWEYSHVLMELRMWLICPPSPFSPLFHLFFPNSSLESLSLPTFLYSKDAGKDRGQEEKGATEDDMVACHHQLKGHEFDQAPGDDEGQGSLADCSP